MALHILLCALAFVSGFFDLFGFECGSELGGLFFVGDLLEIFK